MSEQKNENNFSEQGGSSVMNFCPILNNNGDGKFTDLNFSHGQQMEKSSQNKQEKEKEKQKEKVKDKEKEKEQDKAKDHDEDEKVSVPVDNYQINGNGNQVNHNGRSTHKPDLELAELLVDAMFKQNINNKDMNLLSVSQSVGIDRPTQLLPRGAALGGSTHVAVQQMENKLLARNHALRLGVRGSPLGGKKGARPAAASRKKSGNGNSNNSNSNNNSSGGIANVYGFEDNYDGLHSKKIQSVSNNAHSRVNSASKHRGATTNNSWRNGRRLGSRKRKLLDKIDANMNESDTIAINSNVQNDSSTNVNNSNNSNNLNDLNNVNGNNEDEDLKLLEVEEPPTKKRRLNGKIVSKENEANLNMNINVSVSNDNEKEKNNNKEKHESDCNAWWNVFNPNLLATAVQKERVQFGMGEDDDQDGKLSLIGMNDEYNDDLSKFVGALMDGNKSENNENENENENDKDKDKDKEKDKEPEKEKGEEQEKEQEKEKMDGSEV